MNIHCIQNMTDINFNVDYSHTWRLISTRPSKAMRGMSVVFLTGWWKEDLLSLLHITDNLRTANESLHLKQPMIML